MMAFVIQRQIATASLIFIGLGFSQYGLANPPTSLTSTYHVADGEADSRAKELSTKRPRGRSKRAARALYVDLWPNNTVIYSLASVPNNDDGNRLKQNFLDAIKHIQERTAIRFIEHTDEASYIELTVESSEEEKGGWADVGWKRRKQSLHLRSRSGLRTALHELGHALGLRHEHKRADRARFVKVYSKDDNYSIDRELDLTEPYDYESIMHYSHEPRLIVLDETKRSIVGLFPWLSKTDERTLNRLYPNPSDTVFSPDKGVVQQSEEAIFTLENKGKRTLKAIEEVSRHPELRWSKTVLSNGKIQIRIWSDSGFKGEAELQLRLLYDSEAPQKITLPVHIIAEREKGGANPKSGLREGQIVSLANNAHLRDRNERYGQCLEALDDGYSWFWLKGERTVGMRECDGDNKAQKWVKQGGEIKNVQYPQLCLGKSQWTNMEELGDQARGYAALESCDGQNDQQWEFKEIEQLDNRLQGRGLAQRRAGKAVIIFNAGNKENDLQNKLALMQGNGTIVVEEVASRSLDRALQSEDNFITHYLWQWKWK